MGQGNVFTGVCLSTNRSAYRGVCIQGVSTYRGCLPTGGFCIRGGGVCLQGQSESGGWGFCILAGLPRDFCIRTDGGLGRSPTPETRKAGGTHPTGMLSCDFVVISNKDQSRDFESVSVSLDFLLRFIPVKISLKGVCVKLHIH